MSREWVSIVKTNGEYLKQFKIHCSCIWEFKPGSGVADEELEAWLQSHAARVEKNKQALIRYLAEHSEHLNGTFNEGGDLVVDLLADERLDLALVYGIFNAASIDLFSHMDCWRKFYPYCLSGQDELLDKVFAGELLTYSSPYPSLGKN